MENQQNQAMTPLPKYRCHKEVWALKIKDLLKIYGQDGRLEAVEITPEERGFAPFTVDAQWFNRYRPEIGNYWVQYRDGYSSISPAEAFEEGYTLIS